MSDETPQVGYRVEWTTGAFLRFPIGGGEERTRGDEFDLTPEGFQLDKEAFEKKVGVYRRRGRIEILEAYHDGAELAPGDPPENDESEDDRDRAEILAERCREGDAPTLAEYRKESFETQKDVLRKLGLAEDADLRSHQTVAEAYADYLEG